LGLGRLNVVGVRNRSVQVKQREKSWLVDIIYDVADPSSPTYSQRKLDEKFQLKSFEQSNDFSK
jgi:hypothetical protein